MKYNNNINYFVPKSTTNISTEETVSGIALIPSGANNVYTVDKNRIVRIVTAADTFVKFSTDMETVIANNTNMLLKANQEYFILSGQCSFMSLSNTTCNVIVCQEQ